jgi:hypothetical protein
MRNNPTNPRDAETRFAPAEMLFAKLNAQGKRTRESIEDERLKATQPYTPPSNVLAARKHEVEYKGRDFKALSEAAKRKPRTDDDALKEKFGGGGRVSPPTHGSGNLPDVAPSDPYEPIGTMPVVGDMVLVQYEDGSPWTQDDAGKPQKVESLGGNLAYTSFCEMYLAWFEQVHPIARIRNRILKRAQASTPQAHQGKAEPSGDGVVRAWKNGSYYGLQVGAKCFAARAWEAPDGRATCWANAAAEKSCGSYNSVSEWMTASQGVELSHPEALALWDECKKVLKIDGEVRHV